MNEQQRMGTGETVLRVAPSSLIVLIGPASSGKSTWAHAHFEPTQVVSTDGCRALIADDENDQEATRDALRLFHRIITERLKRGLPTVADSTALAAGAREELLRDAALYHRPVVAVVFAMPMDVQQFWNAQRPRRAPPPVLSEHRQALQHTLHAICDEGFSQIVILHSPEEMQRLIVRIGSFSPENDVGPFDIIGDVHGCYDELSALLRELGYVPHGDGWAHPQRRRAIFVGDLADRGPRNVAVWRTVIDMCEHGNALLVIGNHDNKLMRWLMGRPVRIGKGLLSTISEIESLPEPEQSVFRARLLSLLRSTPGYLLLDRERLVVTHAGIRDDMVGRWDRHISSFCLYGDVAGYDPEGIPQRRNWAMERIARPGAPLIVYGHVVVESPAFINQTVDVDTGCCFGGRLTALRYPERTFTSVPALQVYAEKHG
ncbi:MAG: AAA family ATPase [Ktedonobacterales bacterium]|nr:AAA family ATPase [Ktedonobacterales bacterium]